MIRMCYVLARVFKWVDKFAVVEASVLEKLGKIDEAYFLLTLRWSF